jgi:Beta-propeller repeat
MNRTARKSLIVTTLVFSFALFLAACSQSPDAVKTGTGEPLDAAIPLKPRELSTPQGDYGLAVAANNTGVYAVGYTEGSLDGVNKGDVDAYIRRYDGGVIWGQQFGTKTVDTAQSVAVDNTGNTYVVGTTDGALGFKVGDTDGYVRKYNNSGLVQWTRQFGSAGIDSAISVALDASNNIFVLSQDNSTGFTIRKFSSSGILLTKKTVTSFLGLSPRGIAVDSAGSVVVIANWSGGAATSQNTRIFKFTNTLVDTWNVAFQQTIYIDTGSAITTFGTDIHVIANINNPVYGARYGKLNAAGTLVAIRQLEPTPNCGCTQVRAITADVSGNIYVAGDTQGAFSGFINAGDFDIVLFKLNTASTLVWAKQLGQGSYGTSSTDLGYGVAVSDAVYVTGYTYGNLLGDPKAASDSDAYLAQFDKNTGELLGIDQ